MDQADQRQHVLITRIRLSGWRSFAPGEYAEAEKLARVNLVIGPNNVGKSNIGRFLVRIREILRKMGYQHQNPWEIGGVFYSPLMGSFEAIEADHWLRGFDLVECEIDILPAGLDAPQPIPSWLLTDGSVRVCIQLSRNKKDSKTGALSLVPLSSNGRPVVRLEGSSYQLLEESGSYTDRVLDSQDHWHKSLAIAVCKCLAHQIYEVRALRDPSRNGGHIEGSTNGGEIIQKLLECQGDENRQRDWTRQKSDLEHWLSTLLGENDLRIDVNGSGFWLDVKRGQERFRCALPDLGAGVSEMIMLLAYIRLCPTTPILVVLDEPEAHLHPGAVIELVNILSSNNAAHLLLVTTHSTTLIDAVTPQWRTYRALRAKTGGTALEALDTTNAELALLADLGIRPSQLFLARSIFWVEGPSDILYWTALIKHVEPELLAGRDFAFVMYGGASAAHLDLDDGDGDERLVQVLKVANRSVIVCDRDRNVSDPDRDLVKRLERAAGNLPANVQLVKSCGREIENDVLPDVLLRVLEKVRPVRFNKPELLKIAYEPYHIGVDDEFNAVVAGAARAEDGSALSQDQVSRIKGKLDAAKHSIALRVHEISASELAFRQEAISSAKRVADWLRSSGSS